jgi:hypothetical protein
LDLEENKKKASKSVLIDAAIAFLDAIEKAGKLFYKRKKIMTMLRCLYDGGALLLL